MTLVDESYLQPCDTCGAVVLPQQRPKHLTFHQELDLMRQDLLTLTRSTQEITANVGRLTRTVDRLTGISRMLYDRYREITGRVIAKSMEVN